MTEELGPKRSVAAGLHALPGARTAMASTQAAWRFYVNDAVTAPLLAEPLLASARASVAELAPRWGLVVHDWSQLNFTTHESKTDRVPIGSGSALGYHLQTWLLISDADGAPLAPLGQSLWAADGIHTTRRDGLVAERPHLDEITDAMESAEALRLGPPLLHIIDRGADSVGHFRDWIERGRRFLVRADAAPRVEYEGETIGLGQVGERVRLRAGEAVELSGGVLGQQFVGETRVRIVRAARPHRRVKGVTVKREVVAGPAVEARLVVSEIRTPDEQVVARWLLVTNVGEEVSAEQIARWYYWRWKIESYFKLVKSAGHELESWQQESAGVILKRLLVASMACVVVWHLARSAAPESEEARRLLVRLSGRQMRRNRPATEPALMAGLMILLPMLDALEHYSLADLKRLARAALPGFSRLLE